MVNAKVKDIVNSIHDEIIGFTQELVRTKSNTCKEKDAVLLIKNKMAELGYDKIYEDDMGNVIGIMGEGKPYAMFDGHIDAVDVIDADQWEYGPYSGEIVDGKLYGRGSSDMKAGLVSAIYAGYVAKKAGIIPEGKSIWISASLMEEDYDGFATKYVLDNMPCFPEFVVCCEPTDSMKIANGHRGRCLIEITVKGIACHGSSPELGDNPIYKLSEIFKRVEKLNEDFYKMPKGHPSVAATSISCKGASENAVPESAILVLDRRTAINETEEDVTKEMNELIKGLDKVTWRYRDFDGVSWKGKKFVFHNFLKGWELDENHPLIVKTKKLVKEVCNHDAEIFKFGGSTNATSSAGTYNIPSMVIGPGNLSTAHARNEYCTVSDIPQACEIYAMLCSEEE